MPLFDYMCNSCSHVQERLVRLNSDVQILCEKCNSETTQLIGKPQIQFDKLWGTSKKEYADYLRKGQYSDN